MADAVGGPTVLRLLLGAQPRRLRESQGISAHDAARAIRGSESKISRIELGWNAVREIDIADPALPDMVYAEQLNSATYIDKRAEVEPYLLSLERLSLVSARPADTPEILRAIVAEVAATP